MHPHGRIHLTLLKIKNLHHFPLKSSLRPHPFSNPLSNHRRARTAAACSTMIVLPAAEMRQRAALRPIAVACLPISPPPLTTRRRVL
jgi:hypothetical protein